MTQPSDGLPADLQELLESERNHAAPADAHDRVRNRVYATLGLVGAATVSAQATASAASHASGSMATVSAAKIGITKVLLTVAVGAMAAAGVTAAVRSVRTAPTLQVAATPAPTPTAALPVPPVVNTAPIIAPPAPISHATKAVHLARLAEERTVLDRARAALVQGHAEESLMLISDHGSRFAGGQLDEERDSLRIRALVQLGDMASARQRASAFRTRYPDSIFAGAIEDSLSHPPPRR